MGSKIILTVAFLATPVYAMDVREKFPEYQQQFDSYEQRAEQAPPKMLLPEQATSAPFINEQTMAEERDRALQEQEELAKARKELNDINNKWRAEKGEPPIVTRDDIKIPKFYSVLPEKYREKLINKRIKKEQDKVNQEWLNIMSPTDTASKDRDL